MILLEIFFYILLIGRLLHDSVTQKVLTKQMLAFLASTSDIMELFSLFDEEKVIESSNTMVCVLVLWSFSFLQFIPIWGSHNLGKTETQHKKMLKEEQHQEQSPDAKKHYLPFCRNNFLDSLKSCLCHDSKDDDATETYEMVFAFVVQDGPFLGIRLYIIFKFNLFTQSLVFFSLKNIALTILLIVKYKSLSLRQCFNQ